MEKTPASSLMASDLIPTVRKCPTDLRLIKSRTQAELLSPELDFGERFPSGQAFDRRCTCAERETGTPSSAQKEPTNKALQNVRTTEHMSARRDA
jgi:hypothetical protein